VLLDALAAGKDVFLEKPMSFRLEDGPRMVEAVRKSGRVVQVGTQQKSGPIFKEAKERFVDSGLLGTVNLVRTWWCAWPGSVPPPGFTYKPDELNWDLFLGSMPKRPFDAGRFFGWYRFADFSVGPFGTYGVHNLDVAHFFLGLKRPSAVAALGGIYASSPAESDTPDSISLLAQYPEKVNVTFDYSRWGFGYNYQVKKTVDVEFRGSGGSLNVFRDGYVFVSVDRKKPPVERFPGAPGCPDCDVAHMDDFLASVRSRKQPAADVVYSHYLTAVAHMGNLAHVARKTISWDTRWDVQPIL
jgi:predicted dehydrogenase